MLDALSRFAKNARSLAVRVLLPAALLAVGGISRAEDLAAQVEIRRTAHGVPHVKAETLRAAAFGFAYAQAEDHMLALARLILQARGESALFFGKGHLEADFRVRQFRVRDRAVETYHLLGEDYRDTIEGYAAGVNRYIELHRAELPEWVRPVTPHDVAAHGAMGVMRFAFDRGGIVGKFVREKKASRPGASENAAAAIADSIAGVDAEADRETGSNMIALAPSRTTSGHAMLLGNPHQPWNEVATYYEGHVTVPGVLDFYGSTFIGRPILTTGFNENLGWAHTVNYPDLEEIYELTKAPGDPDAYLFDGGPVAIRSESATVRFKNDDGSTGEETRTFRHTPLGPVIYEDAEHAYILRSSVYEEHACYEQWLDMTRARDLREFREALDRRAVPMFNIAYADRVGNIYYIWNGAVPEIPHVAGQADARAAASTRQIWTRIHAVDELPQLLNPAGGYVQNCNAPPWFTNLYEPIPRENFPAHFPDHRLGHRTQHGLELVHNAKRFSLEDLAELKFSPGMHLAERIKDDLAAAVRASAPAGGRLDDETAKAADLIAAWDGSARAEARGAVLFEIWWDRYAGNAMYPAAGSYAVDWTPDDPMATPRGIGDPARAAKAFREAMAETREKHGAWDVAWGEVHRARRGDKDVPVSGGSGFLGCFRVLDFGKEDDGKLAVRGGDGWILAVEFGETPRAYSVLAYGQSSNPESPWHADQIEMFARGEMKKVAFTEEDVRAATLKSYRPGFE